MRASSLPTELGSAFRVRDALERGVQPSRLRARDLEQPFRGVRVQSNNVGQRPLLQNDESDALRAEVLASARAYALRMEPHEFFSHSTAAHIWGVPLPPLRTSKLHVSVVAPHRPVRVRGVVAHEAQPHLTRVVTHADSGLRVSSPATTWATLGSELWHPYDLVAAGDAFIRVQRFPGPWFRQLPPPLARFDQLEAAVRAGRRVGRPALRAALPKLRTGSASRTESWTRLIICEAGLPEPALDHDVYDARGTFIGCVDQAYPELKIAIEYEGDHHRLDPSAWNRDLAKHDALQAAGWRVIRVSRAMLFGEPELLIARVRAAVRSRA